MRRRTFVKSVVLAASAPFLGRAVLAAPGSPANSSSAFKVMSCNIRVALPQDDAEGNGWKDRRDLCLEVIRNQKPDLIGFQEVLREQMLDLDKGLSGFASFGFVGPEMDSTTGDYKGIAKNPVFYSRDRYELVTEGGFWLSETPHLPGSLSWGSARARHMNWVRLRDRQSGRELRFVNTHLDHISQKAREEQIKMILAEADVYSADFPQVLTGDMNSGATNLVIKFALEAGWVNSHDAAPDPHDNGNTTHGFLGEKYVPKTEAGRKKGPIDFILTHGPISTLDWKIIRDSKNGRYPSDHYFIAARLAFK